MLPFRSDRGEGNGVEQEDVKRVDGSVLLQIGGIVRESIVDGPGIRMTVFTQGCTHACPGCHNQQLQPFEGGTAMTVSEILKQATDNPLLDGITLSGGEPFQQAAGCAALARAARAAGLSVMAYSGYPLEELLAGCNAGSGLATGQTGCNAENGLANGKNGWGALLSQLDILVDGPFILAQRDLLLRFRGSANQRLLDVPASLKAGTAVLFDT